jgi:hypothetical protein
MSEFKSEQWLKENGFADLGSWHEKPIGEGVSFGFKNGRLWMFACDGGDSQTVVSDIKTEAAYAKLMDAIEFARNESNV